MQGQSHSKFGCPSEDLLDLCCATMNIMIQSCIQISMFSLTFEMRSYPAVLVPSTVGFPEQVSGHHGDFERHGAFTAPVLSNVVLIVYRKQICFEQHTTFYDTFF